MSHQPGALVRYRDREWVVLPSTQPQVTLLRPLGGSSREICGVLQPLSDRIGYSLRSERIEPAQFPLPTPEDAQDRTAVRLLLEAARLLLREGAAPFRSLGQLSFRPRPYQFVPLLMALRQETVRLLIADDVGVGKTIEAGLIAKELLARGEVKRVAVLCPPYLCDQWQKELAEKFHIDATVIRSSTLPRLERQTPPNKTVFEHYTHLVASIDLVKSERYREAFLHHCPEMVLVDEAHGAAQPSASRGGSAPQQRHQLVRRLSEAPQRHLILLTATPHGGIEDDFLSILGLLQPEFRDLTLSALTEAERRRLARHFVQRRRADVSKWMGEETPFPTRDESDRERPYRFSSEYRRLYESVYDFAREMVRSAEDMTGRRRRLRFWSALALLRCVSSSPAAVEAALARRVGNESRSDAPDATGAVPEPTDEALEEAYKPVVFDPFDAESIVDIPPSGILDALEQDSSSSASQNRRLRQFARDAAKLRDEADIKLMVAVKEVADLLAEGYQPIVWCRYVDTADYVAQELRERLQSRFPNLSVDSVTGANSDDERRVKVDELAKAKHRVLVATDCLSEGINLQEHFSAAVHYDLPWNPNRLEQREGRVDRFGQPSKTVKVSLIYGQDNPVDGAVLDVLLRKARNIRRDLGIYVPVPMNSEGIMEAVLQSLFMRATHEDGTQLRFDSRSPEVDRFHAWQDEAAERARISRSRFAQHAIKPEEVERELRQTDTVLGTPEAVRAFMLDASQRLGFTLSQQREDRWRLGRSGLPVSVQGRLGDGADPWPITFTSPTPEGFTFVGRNHPVVEGLAEHLMDMAFHPSGPDSPVARCGVIRTTHVQRRTSLLLLRPRYLQYVGRSSEPSLAEETIVWGFRGYAPDVEVLAAGEASRLLDEADSIANVPPAEKREVLEEILASWDELQAPLQRLLQIRATELEESYGRLRELVGGRQVRFEPQMPPDLLGLLVLLPVPGGMS